MNTSSRLRLIIPSLDFGSIGADEPRRYRVRVDEVEPEELRLEPIGQESGDATAAFRVPPKFIPATLLDLGPDGIGVRVSQHAASQLLAFVHCRCELKPPFSPRQRHVVVQVSHSRPLLDGTCYVGLVFNRGDKRRRAVSRSWDRLRF
jgi:hypothetical protein